MFRFDAERTVSFCDGLRRRDFLHAGSLGLLGLSLPDWFALKAQGAVNTDQDMNCIFLMLLGGPSQVDTWDMKPNAPAEIRGPYKPIKTNVPGIEVSEIFPRMARNADKYSLVRGVYHNAAAVHDTGHQMMQTGRLFQAGQEHPHVGCVLSKLRGPRGDAPPHVLLPRPIGNTGGNLPHGQTAGFLGKQFDPFVLNSDPATPNFKVPDMLPPEYISAMRVDRRRKLREMVLASRIERRLTKDEILELYLNRVYFGGGANGIEQASQAYFQKSANALNLFEAALLAATLKSPTAYNPMSRPEEAKKRARVVLDAMAEAGFITQADADQADR